MTDREKVLTGLECLITAEISCEECPYSTERHFCCVKPIAKDAKKLVEEQASVIEALKSDLSETLAVLGEQPEIVRCADCRKKDKEECPMYVDYPCTNKPGDDWFCADGERKNDG